MLCSDFLFKELLACWFYFKKLVASWFFSKWNFCNNFPNFRLIFFSLNVSRDDFVHGTFWALDLVCETYCMLIFQPLKLVYLFFSISCWFMFVKLVAWWVFLFVKLVHWYFSSWNWLIHRRCCVLIFCSRTSCMLIFVKRLVASWFSFPSETCAIIFPIFKLIFLSLNCSRDDFVHGTFGHWFLFMKLIACWFFSP